MSASSPVDPEQAALMSAAWYGVCALAREVYHSANLHFSQARSVTTQYRMESRSWGHPTGFLFGPTVYTIRRMQQFPEKPPCSMGGLIQHPDEAADRASILHQGSLSSIWQELRTIQANQNRDQPEGEN